MMMVQVLVSLPPTRTRGLSSWLLGFALVYPQLWWPFGKGTNERKDFSRSFLPSLPLPYSAIAFSHQTNKKLWHSGCGSHGQCQHTISSTNLSLAAQLPT